MFEFTPPSHYATGTIELALIRKAGTQENLEVDRLVPKPMAADPTQRVGDNAFHLPVFLVSKFLRGGSER